MCFGEGWWPEWPRAQESGSEMSSIRLIADLSEIRERPGSGLVVRITVVHRSCGRTCSGRHHRRVWQPTHRYGFDRVSAIRIPSYHRGRDRRRPPYPQRGQRKFTLAHIVGSTHRARNWN